jgi:tetratricopeptide (TPR) repeat protein
MIKGNMREGFRSLFEGQEKFIQNKRKFFYAFSEHLIGNVYSEIYRRENNLQPMKILKNIGFLIRSIPFSNKKAEIHFKKAIELADNIGALSIKAQAILDLGVLYRSRNRKAEAGTYLLEAIKLFNYCDAEGHLNYAKKQLESLR